MAQRLPEEFSVQGQGGHSYRRTTHYRERVSQRNMHEPAIPGIVRRHILQAYELWPERQAAERRGPLTKEDISALLHLCGLEKRSLLEKWISIRYLLTRYKPPAIPGDVDRDMELDFARVSVCWDRCPHIRTLNGTSAKRDNIINLNFIFSQLLLRHGNDAWQRFNELYPQVSEKKRTELFQYWFLLCEELDWPVWVALTVRPDPPLA